MDERKLRGYQRLVESGLRNIEEVPEPYRSELLSVLNSQTDETAQ